MRGLDPRARLMLGVLTTLMFLGIGGSLYLEGSSLGGAVLVSLGLFRAWMWIRELRRYLEPEEE